MPLGFGDTSPDVPNFNTLLNQWKELTEDTFMYILRRCISGHIKIKYNSG